MYKNVSGTISTKKLTAELTQSLMEKHIRDIGTSITNETGRRGNSRTKVRTYPVFKLEYTESTVRLYCPGTYNLRIETRYENLEVENRMCPFCDRTEDEKHVVLKCNACNDIIQCCENEIINF